MSEDQSSDRACVLAFVEAHWKELTLRDACLLSSELVDWMNGAFPRASEVASAR